jgi:hypothetical protein
MSHLAPTGSVTRSRAFWTVVAYAVLLGVVGGLIAVVFIGLIDWLVELIWTEPAGVGLLDGEPWWILLIGGFGLLSGLGTWLSERQGLPDELRETNTLTGMAGTFGGFLTSPLVSSVLVIEVATPGGAHRAVHAAWWAWEEPMPRVPAHLLKGLPGRLTLKEKMEPGWETED